LPSWPNVLRWSRVLDTKSGSVLAKDITENPGGKFQAPAVAIVAFAGQP
jgi:hypothetical protein